MDRRPVLHARILKCLFGGTSEQDKHWEFLHVLAGALVRLSARAMA